MSAQPPTDDRVLAAARRVLRAHGVEKTTVERIAREAGLSRVTLHRHGVTKASILEALLGLAVEAYQRAMWPALTGEGTGRERLEQALAALCDVAEEHLDVLLGLGTMSDALFHEDGDEPLTRSVFTDPFVRLLRDGAADGSLRTVDATETATVLFNLVGQTYMHLRAGHRWSPKRARQATLDLTVNGLLPDG